MFVAAAVLKGLLNHWIPGTRRLRGVLAVGLYAPVPATCINLASGVFVDIWAAPYVHLALWMAGLLCVGFGDGWTPPSAH